MSQTHLCWRSPSNEFPHSLFFLRERSIVEIYRSDRFAENLQSPCTRSSLNTHRSASGSKTPPWFGECSP